MVMDGGLFDGGGTKSVTRHSQTSQHVLARREKLDMATIRRPRTPCSKSSLPLRIISTLGLCLCVCCVLCFRPLYFHASFSFCTEPFKKTRKTI